MYNIYRAYLTGYARHLLRDVNAGVSIIHHFEDLKRLYKRFRKSEPLSNPPHSIELYRLLLAELVEHPQCHFRTLVEHTLHLPIMADKIHVVLRHDIDLGDPKITLALCQVEQSLGLTSSVHILVDGTTYDPLIMTDAVHKLREDEFDVGLHTQAWMHEDYKAAFKSDLRKFGDTFGFLPKTFSQHGAWPRTDADLFRRTKFTQATPMLIQDTPIIGYNNRRDWTSEDSNIAGKAAPITKNFFRVAELCYIGGVAVILTHDNHWSPE